MRGEILALAFEEVLVGEADRERVRGDVEEDLVDVGAAEARGEQRRAERHGAVGVEIDVHGTAEVRGDHATDQRHLPGAADEQGCLAAATVSARSGSPP